MKMKKDIHRIKLLRLLVLPLLKLFNRDIFIRHHWTGDRMRLNLFMHKGYWYHGRNRETREMEAIKSLVVSADIVAEVGGHIGFLSLLFKNVIGDSGKLYVFEPGANNISYLKENLKNIPTVTIVESGCGDVAGEASFYEDSLTGQNNSFVKEFTGLEENSRNAPGVNLLVTERVMKLVRLDEYFKGVTLNFIKIDVEGFELNVLNGAVGLAADGLVPPIFMIEVQTDHVMISDWFKCKGYQLFTENRIQIDRIPLGVSNVFALHPVHHAHRLANWLDTGIALHG